MSCFMFFRWKNPQVQIKIPQELVSILVLHLGRAHRTISGSNYPFVFSDRKGRHMAEAASMSEYWRYLLVRMGSPTFFPPHRCPPLRSLRVLEKTIG